MVIFIVTMLKKVTYCFCDKVKILRYDFVDKLEFNVTSLYLLFTEYNHFKNALILL